MNVRLLFEVFVLQLSVLFTAGDLKDHRDRVSTTSALTAQISV